MRYEGKIFRPGPTEYNSYLLQVTLGCSHNKCAFCNFYRDKPFRLRPYEEIEEDIMMARRYYKYVPSVFLIDGNVTCLSMNRLKPILKKIKEVFPESVHTNMFGSFRDICRKTADELREMKELGVEMIVAGLESGSDIVLSDIEKGFTADEAIIAGQKMYEADIELGTGVILGLGGVKHSEDHVKGTIRVLNELYSAQIGFTVLNPQTDSPLYDDITAGVFELPSYRQILWEEAEIVKGLQLKRSSIFRTGFFLPDDKIIVGNLPDDKECIIKQVENRMNSYSHLLDRKIMVNGHL
jgi:radical SAM superfamily enzyme YgiQ (UPF0313 family)